MTSCSRCGVVHSESNDVDFDGNGWWMGSLPVNHEFFVLCPWCESEARRRWGLPEYDGEGWEDYFDELGDSDRVRSRQLERFLGERKLVV